MVTLIDGPQLCSKMSRMMALLVLSVLTLLFDEGPRMVTANSDSTQPPIMTEEDQDNNMVVGLMAGFLTFGGILLLGILAWCLCCKVCYDEKRRRVIPAAIRETVEKALQKNRDTPVKKLDPDFS